MLFQDLSQESLYCVWKRLVEGWSGRYASIPLVPAHRWRSPFGCIPCESTPLQGLPRSLLVYYLSVTPSRPSKHERSEEHTSELQSRGHLVCRLLLEQKKTRFSPANSHQR